VRSNIKHKALGGLRRIAILLLVVWTVVSLVTLLIELVPGDPAVAVLGEQAELVAVRNAEDVGDGPALM